MGSVGSIVTRIGAHMKEKVIEPTAVTLQQVKDNTLVFLRDRSTAYRTRLSGRDMASQIILKDLHQFSHFGDTKFIANPYLAAQLRGRQDILLRILQHTTMTVEQLFILFNDGPIPETEENEENSDG